MNNLITFANDGQFPVSGRELHTQLGVGTRYNDWFLRQCSDDFIEGTDYYSLLSNRSDGKPGKGLTDHMLTIGMAKELCILQRNEKGREIRKYLISVEEQWNEPDAVIARAMVMVERKLAQITGQVLALRADNTRLALENKVMEPKAAYFDDLVDRNVHLGIRETAKELCVKQNAFVGFLLGHKYLYRDKKGKLMPYAQYVDDLFVLKECINDKTDWGGTQTLITPKGRETFRLLTEGLSAS